MHPAFVQSLKTSRAILLAALVSVAGCNSRSDIGTVAGTVTCGGQPLGGLEVQFDPQAPGRNSIGFTNAAGEYEAQYTATQVGARVGKHTVAVFDRSGKTSIPAEFTQLSFDVKPGSNQFDINIPAK